MPLDYSDLPDQLRGSDARLLGTIELDRIGVADAAFIRSAPDADPVEIARAIMAGLAGWQITVGDGRVADALVNSGEILVRHAHLMSADLTALNDPANDPTDDSAQRSSGRVAASIAPLQMAPDRYAHLMTSAYPVGHVDHDPAELLPGGALHTVASYLSGEVVGAVRWDASREAHHADEAIGFIVVSSAASGRLYPGGAWITDIAVDPHFHGQGIGGALLRGAMTALAAAGDTRLGLAVSHGNRARDLYTRLGFTEIVESWRFLIAAR